MKCNVATLARAGDYTSLPDGPNTLPPYIITTISSVVRFLHLFGVWYNLYRYIIVISAAVTVMVSVVLNMGRLSDCVALYATACRRLLYVHRWSNTSSLAHAPLTAGLPCKQRPERVIRAQVSIGKMYLTLAFLSHSVT